MSNGTERDEPGQPGENGPQGPAAAGSTPSSDPVWPVWGGATTPADEPAAAAPVDEPAAEADEPATDADEPTADADDPTADADELEPVAGADDAEPTDESDPAEVPADEAVVSSADKPAAEDPAGDADLPADDAAAAETTPADEPSAETATADDVAVADAVVADEPVADDVAGADEPVADDVVVADEAPAEDVAVADDEDPADQVLAEDVAGADEPAADEVAAADEAPAEVAVADDVDAVDEAPAADEPAVDDGAPDADVTPTGVVGADAAEAEVTSAEDAAAVEARSEPVPADVAATESDAEVPPAEDATAAQAQAADDATAAEPDPADAADAEPDAQPDAETPNADAPAGPVAVVDEPAAPEVDSASPTAADPDPEPEPSVAPANEGPRRDAPTAVMDPVAPAAAPSAGTSEPSASSGSANEPAGPSGTADKPAAAPSGAASQPAAVGTLAAAVTRTVPRSAAPPSAPPRTEPEAPAATTVAAAAATGAAAATAGAATAAAAAPTRGPIPSGPVPPSTAAGAAEATAPARGQIPSGPVPQSERRTSPLDVFEPEDGKRRWPRRLLIIGIVVLALAAAYVGASYALADRVPRGATVAGVDIGGLPADEAVTRLEDELAEATTEPIEVVANDVQATIDPTTAGLTFDARATVDRLTGVDLAEPKRLWSHIAGVGEQDPATEVDDAALSAAIGDLGTSLALAPVDGTVVFVDASAQSTAAVDGWDLDQAGAADVLAADWLSAARPIEVPTVVVEPDITQAETDAALAEAQTVVSAPVSVAVAGQVAMIDAPTLAANGSWVPTDGALSLQMNGEGLAAAVLAQLPNLLTQSSDAHFEFVNDAPVIIPGTPGTSLDPQSLATSVGTAAAASDRTANVELVQADPSQSTAELEALGVKQIVAEFSTPLNSEPRRTQNITNGASKINGTLIRPDETFSLTEALGPIDAAHGFVQAGAIVSGEHTDAWGGGLSQLSTTSYNAGFLAGFEDIEHRPHSEWFARYPEGREATIFTGTLDMRWKNNTPYGALVQAWVSGNRVYVRVWSTEHWKVESVTSPRSGVVAPTTVYSQSPTCEPQSAGNPGFSVTVTRKIFLNGALQKTESNSWRYKPQNKVICGAPPTATPPAP